MTSGFSTTRAEAFGGARDRAGATLSPVNEAGPPQDRRAARGSRGPILPAIALPVALAAGCVMIRSGAMTAVAVEIGLPTPPIAWPVLAIFPLPDATGLPVGTTCPGPKSIPGAMALDLLIVTLFPASPPGLPVSEGPKMTRLLFFPGSLRAQASSTALLDALAARLPADVTAQTADIGALAHYNADHDGGAPVAALLAQVRAADGVVFVTPEYNYSVPGVLKNAIDWASRPGYNSVFKGKPCLVVTTSGGALGGVRAQGHLKQILSALLAEPLPWQDIVVPEAPKKLVEGVFADQAVLDFAGAAMAAFLARIAQR